MEPGGPAGDSILTSPSDIVVDLCKQRKILFNSNEICRFHRSGPILILSEGLPSYRFQKMNSRIAQVTSVIAPELGSDFPY